MVTASSGSNPDMTSSSNNGVSSPLGQSRGGTATTPWTQVVVRGESEPIASVPMPPSLADVVEPPTAVAVVEEDAGSAGGGVECGNGNAGNGGKRPAWNKPSNGAAEVGPVMGAHSWPALSETTRGSTSSAKSSSDSLKGLADGSLSSSVSQGAGTANSSLQSQKQVSNNGNPHSTSNHILPTRQRTMKRINANTSSNGALPQPSAPQGPVVEGPSNNPSPRDHAPKGGFGSQSHGGNDHPHQRGLFKNRNSNSHPRGDGSHHHNYGGRRDQDRGNQDWNSHRNFNGRDAHMQQQRGGQRFMRHPHPSQPPPPPSSAPFIPPPPVRPPYPGPIAFHDFPQMIYVAPPPEALRGVPFLATIPPSAVFFPAPDPLLLSRIVNQIDYYFSNENLIKDTYLRQNMDDQGWVPIKLIAGFNKVSLLTDNIQLILDAVRSSSVVEVQGEKIRKRNDWVRWIMPARQYSNVSSPQSQGKSSTDMLAAHVQNISLEQKNHSRSSSSGDLSNQMQLSSSAGTSQGSIRGGPDHSS